MPVRGSRDGLVQRGVPALELLQRGRRLGAGGCTLSMRWKSRGGVADDHLISWLEQLRARRHQFGRLMGGWPAWRQRG